MRLALALLCSALMTSGCSDANDISHDLSRLLSIKDAKTSPPKRASQISPTPAQTAPGRPTSGAGVAAKVPPSPSCPDVKAAAYGALEEPTALPPAKPLITPGDNKQWIERLEGQIGTLKGHLRETAASLSACHAPKS